MRKWIGLLFLTLALGVLPFSLCVPAQTTDWPSIIRAVRPAVVWIIVETRDGARAGTGAIISADGYILTANHVIEGASRITVTLEDSRRYTASVVVADGQSDVAVLKISADELTWVPLGDSDEVEIEEEIRVFGYPLPGAGVGLIVVRGVIQGIRVRDGVRFLQHNATTAGGHSGGPVVNSRGQLIGIHSSVLVDQPEYRLATAVNETRRLIAAAQSGVPVKPIPRPCPTCPPGMVLIPAGVFWMGGDSRIATQELPVHSVSVSMFYMDMYEVTKALWDEVAAWAEANGYDIKPSDGWGKAPDHPVYYVSWYEAVKWANARSEKEGLTPCYYTDAANRNVYRTGQVDVKNEWVKWTANGYRLPTEAEWEKAARGGCEGRRFPWCDSDTIDHGRANYLSCPTDTCHGDYPDDVSATKGYNPAYATGEKPYTSPVGSFAANGYGLYDMAGNVAEWCWDSYWGVVYWSGERVDPRGPSFVSERVVRGGSWEGSSYHCRVSFRLKTTPDGTRGIKGWSIGFRLVRSGL